MSSLRDPDVRGLRTGSCGGLKPRCSGAGWVARGGGGGCISCSSCGGAGAHAGGVRKATASLWKPSGTPVARVCSASVTSSASESVAVRSHELLEVLLPSICTSHAVQVISACTAPDQLPRPYRAQKWPLLFCSSCMRGIASRCVLHERCSMRGLTSALQCTMMSQGRS